MHKFRCVRLDLFVLKWISVCCIVKKTHHFINLNVYLIWRTRNTDEQIVVNFRPPHQCNFRHLHMLKFKSPRRVLLGLMKEAMNGNGNGLSWLHPRNRSSAWQYRLLSIITCGTCKLIHYGNLFFFLFLCQLYDYLFVLKSLISRTFSRILCIRDTMLFDTNQ